MMILGLHYSFLCVAALLAKTFLPVVKHSVDFPTCPEVKSEETTGLYQEIFHFFSLW